MSDTAEMKIDFTNIQPVFPVSNLTNALQQLIALYLGCGLTEILTPQQVEEHQAYWRHERLLTKELLRAIEDKHSERMLIALFLGANPNGTFCGKLLLQVAVNLKNIEQVRILYQFGAFYDSLTFDEDTPCELYELVWDSSSIVNPYYGPAKDSKKRENYVSSYDTLWLLANGFIPSVPLRRACPCTFNSEAHARTAGVWDWEDPYTKNCKNCGASLCEWRGKDCYADCLYNFCSCCNFPYDSCTCGNCI